MSIVTCVARVKGANFYKPPFRLERMRWIRLSTTRLSIDNHHDHANLECTDSSREYCSKAEQISRPRQSQPCVCQTFIQAWSMSCTRQTTGIIGMMKLYSRSSCSRYARAESNRLPSTRGTHSLTTKTKQMHYNTNSTRGLLEQLKRRLSKQRPARA